AKLSRASLGGSLGASCGTVIGPATSFALAHPRSTAAIVPTMTPPTAPLMRSRRFTWASAGHTVPQPAFALRLRRVGRAPAHYNAPHERGLVLRGLGELLRHRGLVVGRAHRPDVRRHHADS